MLRLICPKCKKASYTSTVEPFVTCGYCRFVFSGKYGPDRRKEKRIKNEMPFIFSYQGQNIETCTTDFSKKGLGIKIFRVAPMEVKDILDISIGDLQFRAKVVWVKKQPDESLVGLSKVKL